MTTEVTLITSPIGRLVAGSVHKGSGTDPFNNNEPYIFQSGPKKGQQKFKYWFALAIAKGKEKHWKETEWGKTIYQIAEKRFPKHVNANSFSWKITDGDSTEPNMKGVSPSEKEGYPGNWIIALENWSDKEISENIYTRDGKSKLQEGLEVMLGDYIQVVFSAKDNDSAQKPGVHLNPKAVSYCGLGERIIRTSFEASSFFGKSDLPPGAVELPEHSITSHLRF